MNSEEKHVNYNTTNTYNTLNTLTNDTKNIWSVFHGMGHLSRYFLRFFESLSPEENYLVAPQAPSKYYMRRNFKHVGASWLTKENTKLETENILNYVKKVYDTEIGPALDNDKTLKFHILGFSQGVSIATRFMSKYDIQADTLMLHSGAIPVELNNKDFKYFEGLAYLIYGTNDEYLTEERITAELEKGKSIFDKQLKVKEFNGTHEIHLATIRDIITI